MSVSVKLPKWAWEHNLAILTDCEISAAAYVLSVYLCNIRNIFLCNVTALLPFPFFFAWLYGKLHCFWEHICTVCTLPWALHFINQLYIFIKDDVSSSLTFIPWPRLSSELISRPSLQACKQEITFWLSILPGRIVRLARLPWKYWANLGLVTSPPVRKRIQNDYWYQYTKHAPNNSLCFNVCLKSWNPF